jgi:hypothetical protein
VGDVSRCGDRAGDAPGELDASNAVGGGRCRLRRLLRGGAGACSCEPSVEFDAGWCAMGGGTTAPGSTSAEPGRRRVCDDGAGARGGDTQGDRDARADASSSSSSSIWPIDSRMLADAALIESPDVRFDSAADV